MTALEVFQYVGGSVGAGVAAFLARKVSKDAGASKDASTNASAEIKAALDAHAVNMAEKFDEHRAHVDARLDDTIERVARVERRLSPPGLPAVRARIPSRPR